jgi:hypothetical protein
MKMFGDTEIYEKLDLAELLCVKGRTVADLVKAGRLPPPDVKIGVTDCWTRASYRAAAKLKATLAAERKAWRSEAGRLGMASRYKKAATR